MSTTRKHAWLFVALLATSAHAGEVRQVEVTGPRITLGDVVRDLPPTARDVDLGAVPGPGASRIVSRAEIARSLPSDVHVALPDAVRVVRKMQRLRAADLEQLARRALATLPRGVTLGAVRAAATADVASGYTDVAVTLPRLPRRTGSVASTVMLDFRQSGVVVQSVSVHVDFVLGAEAAVPDVTHGQSITLVIRRGLVEISAPATANIDADVGDVIPVTIPSSGRALRARVESRDRAVAVEVL